MDVVPVKESGKSTFSLAKKSCKLLVGYFNLLRRIFMNVFPNGVSITLYRFYIRLNLDITIQLLSAEGHIELQQPFATALLHVETCVCSYVRISSLQTFLSLLWNAFQGTQRSVIKSYSELGGTYKELTQVEQSFGPSNDCRYIFIQEPAYKCF